jgi:hypothetical protein
MNDELINRTLSSVMVDASTLAPNAGVAVQADKTAVVKRVDRSVNFIFNFFMQTRFFFEYQKSWKKDTEFKVQTR